MDYTAPLNWGLTALKALMAVIPNVPWWYFPVFVIPAIWVTFFGFLFLYITIARGENDRVLRGATNFLWISNAAALLAFILTRQSPLEALGYLIVCTIIFEVAFIHFAVAYRRLWPSPIWWKKWLGAAIVVGVIWWGYAFDVNFNLTWGRLVFWQKPRLFMPNARNAWLKVLSGEMTFTESLQRNVYEGVAVRGDDVGFVTWQGATAYFICTRMVEPWDPNHCGLADLRA